MTAPLNVLCIRQFLRIRNTALSACPSVYECAEDPEPVQDKLHHLRISLAHGPPVLYNTENVLIILRFGNVFVVFYQVIVNKFDPVVIAPPFGTKRNDLIYVRLDFFSCSLGFFLRHGIRPGKDYLPESLSAHVFTD